MNYCAYCGSVLPVGALFCPRCGKKVPELPDEPVLVGDVPATVPPPLLAEDPPFVAEPPPPPPDDPLLVAPPPLLAENPPFVAAPPPPLRSQTAGSGAVHGDAAPRANAAHAATPLKPAAEKTRFTYTPATSPVVAESERRGRRSGGGWWIVPLVIIGLVLLAFIVISILPADGDGPQIAADETGTIGEGTSTLATATIADIPTPSELPRPTLIEEPGVLTGTLPPNVMTSPTSTVAPTTTVASTSTTAPPPRPVQTQSMPPAQVSSAQSDVPPAAEAGELSGAEAVQRVRQYITSRHFYRGIADSCVQVRPGVFSNGGYTLQVWHACPGAAGSRLLGRWRVDTKSGEVFRQYDDGRYLSP